MSEYETESTPDLEDIQQDDGPELPALRVDVEGSVYAHILPHRIATMKSYRLSTTPQHVANADSRRGRLVLWATCAAAGTGTVFSFGARDEVGGGLAGRWPARPPESAPAPPLVMLHTEAVHACLLAGDANDVILTVISENWAD